MPKLFDDVTNPL